MQSTMGIDTYIIKTASFCNLNCSYCYYFNGADTSFKNRPHYMSQEVVVKTVDRILSHAAKHHLNNIDVSLHGGEPLLMGKSRFIEMMREYDRLDRAGIKTRRKVQTNGVLLNDEWLDLLNEWQLLIGVSIDGSKETHDAFRVDHHGRGSYLRTVRGLKKAIGRGNQVAKVGVISVINPSVSGAETYTHLRSLGVEWIDFIIPEGNYANHSVDYVPLGDATPYADFLIEAFDAWMQEDNRNVRVRGFERLIRGSLGQTVNSDAHGSSPVRVAVIETDGSMEPTDNFKACADRMTDLGLNVFDNDFDDLFYHEFFDLCMPKRNTATLPVACQSCRFQAACGGGRITHRYSTEHGFSERSIYCNDLYKLYQHVDDRVARLKRATMSA